MAFFCFSLTLSFSHSLNFRQSAFAADGVAVVSGISRDTRRFRSVREVRAAFRRYWRCVWLLPLIAAIGILIALIVNFRPQPDEPVLPPVAQTDTVVVVTPPAQPAVDSTWLNIRNQAAGRYQKLYRLYADSLTNMPEKSLNEGFAMTNRYAARMFAQREKLITTL